MHMDFSETHANGGSTTSYYHTLMYGPQTDLVMFDLTGPYTNEGNLIYLGDHLNTVRDVVRRDSTTGNVVAVNRCSQI